MTSTIYIALILQSNLIITCLDVVAYFNKLFPSNTLNITSYITNNTQQDIDNFLTDFLSTCPPNSKIVIITSYSNVLQICSEYLQQNNLNILTISLNATSSLISSYTNVISYVSSDKLAAMNSFLIFKDYQMDELKILYDPLIVDPIFGTSYIYELTKQATLLNIKYSVSEFVEGKDNYDIKKKSCIYLIADSIRLLTNLITNDFLKNIPEECYFILTDQNTDINFNCFNNIPALVLMATNINYTPTSKMVYDNIKNNTTGYGIYALYDILFILNYFTTLTNTSITKENWININPYNSITLPAWILNSYIDPILQCPKYGKYCLVYVNNIIIGDDSNLYLKYYGGGQQYLPNSYSIFKNVGITPNNPSLIEYDEANYYEIYNSNNKLVCVKFNSDVTNFPIGKNLNVGKTIPTKFIYKYNDDGYFIKLERLYPNNGIIPKVNSTMSKIPIKLKYII